MYYVTVGAIGAGLAVFMAILVRAKLYYLVGLAPLFPSFALLGHLLALNAGSPEGMRMAAIFGLYSLIPYASYLATVIVISRYASPLTAISCATAIWFVLALPLAEAWRRGYLPSGE